MFVTHKEYVYFELPDDWDMEEEEESLFVYDPNGDGALVLSFFTLVEKKKDIYDQLEDMAKRFINQNQVALDSPLSFASSGERKKTLFGSGLTLDNWFVKIWVVASNDNVLVASYQSERRSDEESIVDSIMESIKFNAAF